MSFSAPSLIQCYFDSMAADWDTWNRYSPAKLQAFVTLSGLRPGMRVLDAGCGTGPLFPAILEYNPKELVGVDFSLQMLRRAGQKCRDPRLRLVQKDILEFSESGFDCAFLCGVYPHFPDKQALAAQICKLLSPGGRFLVAHGESAASLNKRLRLASVRSISTHLSGARQEARLWKPFFNVDLWADTDSLYIFSGTRRPDPVCAPFPAPNSV